MIKPDEEKFIAFFEGNSSENELKEIHAWIKESEENVAELFEMESVYRQVKAAAIPTSQIENTYRKIEARQTNEYLHAKKIRNRKLWQYSVAAMVCLVVGITALLGGFSAFGRKMIVAQAPDNGILKVILNDSTTVWLNKNAKMYYPREFADNRRLVKIDGEAFFDVTKDKSRPFVVQGNKLKVSVLGTQFNFNDNANEDDAVVSLFKGSVQVEGNNDEGKIRIVPGQIAHLHSKDKYISVEKRETKWNELWHSNKIEFTNANMESIAGTLESIYKVRIDLDKRFNEDETYSGTILRSNSLDTVLNLLQAVIPMEFEIRGKEVKVIKSNRK